MRARLVGGNFASLMLFWPLTRNQYGFGMEVTGLCSLSLEWSSFLKAFVPMLKSKDLQTILKPSNSNLFLAGPLVAIIASSCVGFGAACDDNPLSGAFSCFLASLLNSVLKTPPNIKSKKGNMRLIGRLRFWKGLFCACYGYIKAEAGDITDTR